MHLFSILTLLIFVAGYITARWDLFLRFYELTIFAWDHSVIVSIKPHCLTSVMFLTTNLRRVVLPKASQYCRSSFSS